jgi:hypothetical protein
MQKTEKEKKTIITEEFVLNRYCDLCGGKIPVDNEFTQIAFCSVMIKTDKENDVPAVSFVKDFCQSCSEKHIINFNTIVKEEQNKVV